ncbi:MAG: gephyrin-like molybdotransferase Glp, partial [Gemmatimonadales bacterium]
MTAPLTARDAALRILEAVQRQPPLRTPLDDATGSILAQDIVSPLDIPPWTNSAMDGYAARAEDVKGASDRKPVRLNVIEELPAGAFPELIVGTGECARIFT